MSDDEGATPREVVVEACRRDQPHLIEQIQEEHYVNKDEEFAEFINGVTDSMGNHALHICAMYGSYDAMDRLFDIYHFECDPQNRIDKDTPLHLAVLYANEKDANVGMRMIEMMLEAGCDPRVKNKHGKKPIDFTVPQHVEVKTALFKAEYILQEFENVDNNSSSDGEPTDDEDGNTDARR
ncbi:hypothetical protein FQN57_004786 [Myotisia sp. PD_48]|nr:hypothetical protein FQN57_004786 [Myotisia sp. PD_48]